MTRDNAAAAMAVEYAQRFIGRPYRWGGDDPLAGFDCSGFINEILQAAGYLPHGMDYTAEGLRRLFDDIIILDPKPDCLVFWLKEGKAVHVEMALNRTFTIGASGGGSGTTTIQDAINQNAFIKIRPMRYRGPADVILADPFLSGGGPIEA